MVNEKKVALKRAVQKLRAAKGGKRPNVGGPTPPHSPAGERQELETPKEKQLKQNKRVQEEEYRRIREQERQSATEKQRRERLEKLRKSTPERVAVSHGFDLYGRPKGR